MKYVPVEYFDRREDPDTLRSCIAFARAMAIYGRIGHAPADLVLSLCLESAAGHVSAGPRLGEHARVFAMQSPWSRPAAGVGDLGTPRYRLHQMARDLQVLGSSPYWRGEQVFLGTRWDDRPWQVGFDKCSRALDRVASFNWPMLAAATAAAYDESWASAVDARDPDPTPLLAAADEAEEAGCGPDLVDALRSEASRWPGG